MRQDARTLDGKQRGRHGGQSRLHVAGAPTVDLTGAQRPLKGVERPARAGRDRVEMAAQDERRPRPANAGIKVGPPWRDLNEAAGDAPFQQERREELCASPLVARRVFARMGNQLTKQRQRFVLVDRTQDATVALVKAACTGTGALVPRLDNGTMMPRLYRQGRSAPGPLARPAALLVRRAASQWFTLPSASGTKGPIHPGDQPNSVTLNQSLGGRCAQWSAAHCCRQLERPRALLTLVDFHRLGGQPRPDRGHGRYLRRRLAPAFP